MRRSLATIWARYKVTTAEDMERMARPLNRLEWAGLAIGGVIALAVLWSVLT